MAYWPEDGTHYAGSVKHLNRDGCVTVLHDDGNTEKLNMVSEVQHYGNTNNDDSVTARNGRTTDAPSVVDTEAAELQKMKYSRSKPFLRHQAQ